MPSSLPNACSQLRWPVPDSACDSHVHVFDPLRFPYDPARRYTPGPATVAALRETLARLGMGRVVLVQPSCYGTDNGALRHALSELGERARGVAVIGSLRPGELLELQAAGVRGVRLNLSVSGESDLAAAGQALLALQDAVGPMGWHIQMFASAPTIRALLPRLNQLEVGLVLDHYAGISLTEPDPGGEDAVMQLLARGSVYVKLSAPYRIGAAGRGRDAELAALTRRLAEAAPDRLLWASDWPHTGGAGRRGAGIDAIEPFRDEDAGDTLARLSHWLPDPAAWRRLLIDNPARLYGFSDAG